MKKLILFCVLFSLIIPASVFGQDLYFPAPGQDQWEETDPVDLGWDTDLLEELIEFIDEGDSRAFIVLVDGKMVVEEYFGDFVRDSVWYWASAGKSLTAFLTGMLVSEGLLSVDDPVSDWLGEGWTSAPPEKEELITVENQLSMTTGLDFDVEDQNCTLDTCLKYRSDAGTSWYYYNAPYTLIASVLEEASGQRLNQILFNRLSTQTGIFGLYVNLDFNRIMFSTPRNFARFGLLMLAEGYWDGELLMEDRDYFHQMITPSQDLNPSYGYLWWLNGQDRFIPPEFEHSINSPLAPDAPDDMYAALGLNGQILQVIPQYNMVIVRMGEEAGNVPVPFLMNSEIWNYMNRILPTASELTSTPNCRPTAYPNPSTGLFNLNHLTDCGDFEYRIYGSDGNLVQKGINETEFDLRNQPAGIYHLELISDQGRFTEKLMVVE